MPNDMPPARKRTSTSNASPAAPMPRRQTSASVQRVQRPAAKLVATAGPKAGSEFPLAGEEVVLGRAAENAVSIPDTSVSRRHVMLRRVDQGWMASDLGSGNGTLLNGEQMVEETLLRNADTLTLGDTELTFVDVENVTDRRPVPVGPSVSGSSALARRSSTSNAIARSETRPRVPRAGARKQDPAAKRRKVRLMIYACLFVVLSVGVFAGLKLKDKRKLEVEAKQAQLAGQRRAQLAALYQEGKNLVRAGNWADAKGKFEEVKQMEPSYPGVTEYLSRAELEIPNQKALAEAEAALKENKIGPAGQALAKVSGETQLFQQLRTLKTQLDEKLVARLGDARQAMEVAPKVSTAKDTSKYDEVIAITEDVLQYQPDNRDAKVLHEQAQSARDILTKPVPPPPPVSPKPWEDSIKRFVDGDTTGAFSIANACADKFSRCKTLVSQMTEFQNLYKKVEDLDARGLSQLLALDAKITEGRTSKMARNAGTRAATIYYKSAAAAKTSQQWPRAMEYALKALKADPSNAAAQAIVAELKQKAKDLYLQGYAVRGTNPEDATTKFREVVAMTPADDEWHQKAQRRLEELGSK